MDTKFNFNSQVCTDKNQSERLLALGLKKETADCYWFYCDIAKEWKCTILSSTQVFKDYPTTVIPAWSLHRLIEMMPKGDIAVYDEYYREGKFPMWWHIEFDNWKVWLHDEYECTKVFRESPHLFGNIISCIEWLIKKGYFNKEYLV